MKVDVEMMKKLVGMISSIAFLLTMTSCLDSDDDTAPVDVAFVSIYHASPDAPDLDVILDDEPLFNQPLEYTDFTDYLQFYTGSRDLAFNTYNATTELADTTFNFQNNKAYSVFVVDELSNLSTVIVEDEAETPGSGEAMVRFVQLSPDAPALDLTIGEEDSLVFSDRSFKQITDFTEIDADSYPMVLTDSETLDTLVSVSDADLDAGKIYTIIARGFLDTPSGNNNSLSIQIIEN